MKWKFLWNGFNNGSTSDSILDHLFQARNEFGWSDFSDEFLFYTRGEGKLVYETHNSPLIVHPTFYLLFCLFICREQTSGETSIGQRGHNQLCLLSRHLNTGHDVSARPQYSKGKSIQFYPVTQWTGPLTWTPSTFTVLDHSTQRLQLQSKCSTLQR